MGKKRSWQWWERCRLRFETQYFFSQFQGQLSFLIGTMKVNWERFTHARVSAYISSSHLCHSTLSSFGLFLPPLPTSNEVWMWFIFWGIQTHLNLFRHSGHMKGTWAQSKKGAQESKLSWELSRGFMKVGCSGSERPRPVQKGGPGARGGEPKISCWHRAAVVKCG